MNKILLVLALALCGCGFLGIDDDGDKTDGKAPIEVLTGILHNLGPWGAGIATVITIAGSAVVGHKKGKAKGDNKAEYAEQVLTAVVGGVEKSKDEMKTESKDALVVKLKKNIPNKYHGTIDIIRDAL